VSAEKTPLPRRPFRDTAVFYGALSILFVLIVWATGGSLLPRWEDDRREIGGLLIAALFFLFATGYGWWRFKQRLRLEAEAEAERERAEQAAHAKQAEQA
jgi:type VI protein secretion system component VasK